MDDGIIGGLDWRTPLMRVNVGGHWRIWVCVVILTVPAVAVWHWLYPNTFWFDRLWAGVVGSFVGVLVGSCWQLWDKKRRGQTSGKLVGMLLIAWGLFSVIAITENAPQMRAEETELAGFRAIKVEDIEAIEIEFEGKETVRVNYRMGIERFAKLLQKAELFYRSHEGAVEEFRVNLIMINGQRLAYNADIPERHQGDLSFSFSGPSNIGEILVPRGRFWLDQVRTAE